MKVKINLKPRERILVAAVIAVASVLSFGLGNEKQVQKIKTIESDLSTKNEELNKKQIELTDLQAKAETIQRALSGKWNLKKYLESSKYMAELLKELGAKEGVDKYDFHLKSLTIKGTEKVNSFNRTTFNLEIESNFIELGKYLAALEKSELLVQVQSVKLTRIDNDLKRCVAIIEVHGYHNYEVKL
jgi:Tfp pilus assembly protein PilO